MSDKQFEIQLIKGNNLQTDLDSLLKSYTKSQLIEIAESLNAEMKKSWKKDKLIATLQESILDRATTIYGEILEEVLSHLPDTESQIYRLNGLEEIKAFVPLIKKGFFYVSKEQDDYIFIIPDELREAVQVPVSPTDSTESNELTEKEIILNEWKDRQIAIFGHYSATHLKTIWNRYYDDNLTDEEVSQLL